MACIFSDIMRPPLHPPLPPVANAAGGLREVGRSRSTSTMLESGVTVRNPALRGGESLNGREWANAANWSELEYFSARDSRLWVPRALADERTRDCCDGDGPLVTINNDHKDAFCAYGIKHAPCIGASFLLLVAGLFIRTEFHLVINFSLISNFLFMCGTLGLLVSLFRIMYMTGYCGKQIRRRP
jgi:hypothetical protein